MELSDLEMIIDGKAKDLGGFAIRRTLPTAQRRMVGPFVFLDHMGPVDLQIDHGMDVRPHPHIGLSTLTYLFEGRIMHRDTLGIEQEIAPGAVNWMTAGSGVAHSERSSIPSRRAPQRIHGLQTWVALPKEHEETAASFHHHPDKEIPEISHQGSVIRVVAGQFEGLRSPVPAFSELTYLDVQLPAGNRFSLSAKDQELAVYVVSGNIRLQRQNLSEGQLGVFTAAATQSFEAMQASRVLVLGGIPLAEPRHIWWNFVSSSKERIERAKDDWKNGAFGTVRGETEFIPLPEN